MNHHHPPQKSRPRRSRTPTSNHNNADCNYSIESLNSTTTSYSSNSSPLVNWKTVFCILVCVLSFGVIVLFTRPSLELDYSNTTVVEQSQEQTPVQFDYNTDSDSEHKSEVTHPRSQVSEFIHLYKLPPPVDNDDYKVSRFNKNTRHHYYNTGVFRPPKSRLWDPHPQYIFHAFNIRFHLVLNQISKKHSFIMPGFKVTTHRGRSETWVSRDTGNDNNHGEVQTFEGCFYNGYVLGDLDSSVAVSLCNGMTGHIRTSTGSYFIEPRYRNSEEHEIYQIASLQHRHHDDPVPPPHNRTTNLKITPYDYYSDEDYDSAETLSANDQGQMRSKRSLSTERYVELTVVTDQTMSRYHGDNLKHYVLTLLSIVALVYRDASIGNPVNIVLVNFHVLTDTDFSGTSNSTTSLHGTSASEMLRNFCKWQKEHNHPDDRHPLHHDTALLLTRETICRNPWVGKCDTLGLAELGTMCDHYASCAIVQDNGLSAAFTIAHELGHVLNMPHDDDYKCSGFVKLDGDDVFDDDNGEVDGGRGVEKRLIQHYVMSRMLDHNTYPWAWSMCSRHFLTEFLDAGHGYCLEDKPDSNLLYNDDENSVDDETGSQQPGEIFSEHKQCELVFGPNSQLCSYMPPCRRLWCTNHGGPESEESEGCRTQHMPWADGTRCGANKWCQRGQCVLKDLEKLKIINGGWGGWQEYGECSRSCGGGVKKSYRECDHPKPRNGGKYCVGPRVRYESCSTFDCGNSTTGYDFRASQCGAFDNDNFNIHGLPEDVVWVPKYNGISSKDRCKLFCRVQGSSSYYLLKEKVIDGTPCGIDTFDVCVNGACLPAGCDRRLHSSKALDICGVCGGDSSTCTTTQGSYNSTKYGYNQVIKIPSGASNIDIRQRSYDNTARDDNYLALLDPLTTDYVLNGHFVVSMFRKTIHYGGSILEYSGSDQIVERINSSSRPIKRDLEIRVLSVGKLKPPDIVFQYVISSSDNTTDQPQSTDENVIEYEWTAKRESDRPQCSSACQGQTLPPQTYECVRKPNNNGTPQPVQQTHCTTIPKPPHKAQPCNTHCTIKYTTSCPESCVNARNYTLECIRLLHSTNTSQKISDNYCVKSGLPKPLPPDCVSECRNRKPKWRYTQWSECSLQSAPVSVRCSVTNSTSNGVQIRNVWCQRFNWRSLVDPTVDNFEVVEDTECEGDKPPGRRACRRGANSVSGSICGEWKIDQWSPCSTTCGPGRTRALYACMLTTTAQTQILPQDYCLHIQKPIVERPCELIPCARYTETNWSDCNCSTRTESREITCVINNSPSQDHSVCDRLSISKPETLRTCTSSCNEYNVGDWSEDCRLYNGKSYRYRSVTCDNGNCGGSSPESMLECGEWKVESNWSGCNGSCSVGVELRSVGCYVNERKVEESHCDGVAGGKPIGERKCYHSCNNPIKSLRMGGRGEEGYGGGVNPATSTNSPYFFYNINREVVYKWAAGAFGKCTRVFSSRSSQQQPSCPSPPEVSVFMKHRQVKCISEPQTAAPTTPPRRVTQVSSAYCTVQMPVDSANCTVSEIQSQVPPCPVWATSEWTACTVHQNTDQNCQVNTTILHGTKTRSVSCVQDTTNSSLPEEHCGSKPESQENCVVKGTSYYKYCSGVVFRWRVGNWSVCLIDGSKKKCGGKGGKSRDVGCVRVWRDKEVVVDDSFCSSRRRKSGRVSGKSKSNDAKPRGTRDCVRACKESRNSAFKWITGLWSNCSRPCGGYGLSSRKVSCHRSNSFDWLDPEPLPAMVPSHNTTNYCPPPKPKEYDYCIVSESCEVPPSAPNSTYSWSTSAWSDCGCPINDTTTPTTSFQKRKVFCTTGGSKTPAKHCANITKPPRKQKCECNVYKSCDEMKTALISKFIEVKDGDYILHVGGKAGVKVYCHGMTDLVNVPKEYVSVAEDTNYSEIYDKRLIRPETCPRNGSRMGTCECVNDRNRRVGLTKWRRVRVNVTNLRVDVDDYTFAYSTQDLIPYGTAGDCYSSSMTCPQGRFALDLRNTGFAVSSLTNWSTTGHRATMRVVRKNFGPYTSSNVVSVSQFIQGKCGGYCGTCAVSKGVGMRLDVV